VKSPGQLSRRYIELHDSYDIDGMLELVDDSIYFKRAEEEPLVGAETVRRQYLEDWEGHERVAVTVRRIFESESSAAIKIHVESGPPSNVQYDGVVVHDWSGDGRLVRYRLYVDEVLPSSDPDHI
jgi:ketosteroid isomerase-like protein